MLAALDAGGVSADSFHVLQYGRRSYGIPNRLLEALMRRLLLLAEGAGMAASLIAMRYHGAKEAPLDEGLLQVGREIIEAISGASGKSLRGSDVLMAAQTCLVEEAGAETARRIARRMVSAAADEFEGGWSHSLPSLIFQRYPVIALDAFLGARRSKSSYWLDSLLGGHDSDDHPDARPLSFVDDDVLKAWVLRAPKSRAARLAQYVTYYVLQDEVFRWTPIALWLLELRDGGDVGEVFARRFHVGSWSGSTTSRYVRRLNLTEGLLDHANTAVAAWARHEHEALQRTIRSIEEHERAASERFE
jgi:hypothetical protein